MKKTSDVAIVGLGAMGSAVAYHSSKRGQSVVGFDLSTPPHTLGSTHGESRIIREAYFEHPLYVPIVQRSYECWSELQEESGERLLLRTGGILIGPREGTLVAGTRFSADLHRLDYEVLSAKQIRKHYPALEPEEPTVGIWEPRAGILLPEKCVEAHLALAQRHGAELHFNEPVTEWKPDRDGVAVTTPAGTYRASRLVLAPGPWMSQFLPDLALPLSVERQVLYWFDPAEDREHFDLERLPVFAWEYMSGQLFYGFPNLGNGVKVALHHHGEITEVDSIDRNVGNEEAEAMRLIVRAALPKLAGPLLHAHVCMYTNTPDEHFAIDFHPDLRQVLIVSACSGHGFKFAAVVGEIVSGLLVDGRSAFDLSPFRISRLLEKRA
jgi:sarcosine oxidase